MPTLLNLTGRDVSVLVGGELVLLPAGPRPSLLDYSLDPEPLEVSVGAGTVELTVADAAPTGSLFLPDQEEGTLLLVRPEVLLRCPDRSDLVTPALYGMLPRSDDRSGRGTHLVAVSRSLSPLPAGAPNASMGDLVDADSGAPVRRSPAPTAP